MAVICPKCGFRQDSEDECLRCGLIFARYKGDLPLPGESGRMDPSPGVGRRLSGRGWLRRGRRMLSWASLGAILVVAALVLKTSPQPEIDTAPQAMERAESKLHRFQRSVSAGRPDRLSWTEAELNAWLGANLGVAPPASAEASGDERDGSAASRASVEQVRSNVRDVKIDLLADRLRAYVTFNLYGKDLSLLLEGRLSAVDGYLRLDPTGGMLGSLPLPQGTLESAVRRLFDSPQNREKFRLPPSIKAVAIEDGRFVINGLAGGVR